MAQSIISAAFICFAVVIGNVSAKQMTIAVRNNVTHACPNVKSDLVDTKSIKMDFQMIGAPAGTRSTDQVTVISQNGEQRSMTFPGCYRVQLSFKLKQRLENPYIEAFLQMGTNLPCQSGDQEPLGTVSNICTNITQTNWCPMSQHGQLRSMLQAKSTCRFCNLCGSLKAEEGSLRRYITPENGSDKKCSTNEQYQTLSFKMCTPTKAELSKANNDNEGRLEEYWNYLKQGILTAVIHVMDRAPQAAAKTRQCQKLCESYEENSSPSVSYKQTLLKSIESLCSPKDTYAACVYHTVKFDVYGGLS
uniref:Venom protein n=1 Tax=Panagrellus redivivus TaxID=6233 RepID=A0A7E4V8Y8_PANRE